MNNTIKTIEIKYMYLKQSEFPHAAIIDTEVSLRLVPVCWFTPKSLWHIGDGVTNQYIHFEAPIYFISNNK